MLSCAHCHVNTSAGVQLSRKSFSLCVMCTRRSMSGTWLKYAYRCTCRSSLKQSHCFIRCLLCVQVYPQVQDKCFTCSGARSGLGQVHGQVHLQVLVRCMTGLGHNASVYIVAFCIQVRTQAQVRCVAQVRRCVAPRARVGARTGPDGGPRYICKPMSGLQVPVCPQAPPAQVLGRAYRSGPGQARGAQGAGALRFRVICA